MNIPCEMESRLTIGDVLTAVESPGKAAGALVAILGFLMLLWRAGQVVFRWAFPHYEKYGRNCALMDDLRKHFGDAVAPTLRKLLSDISRSHSQINRRATTLEIQAGIGIYTCDSTTGKYLTANPVLCDLLGLDSTEMGGWGWTAALEEPDKVRRKWTEACTLGLPYHDTYIVNNRRTGERYFVQTGAFLPDDAYDQTTYCGWVRKVNGIVPPR